MTRPPLFVEDNTVLTCVAHLPSWAIMQPPARALSIASTANLRGRGCLGAVWLEVEAEMIHVDRLNRTSSLTVVADSI